MSCDHEYVPVPGTDGLKTGLQMVTCVRCGKPGWVFPEEDSTEEPR